MIATANRRDILLSETKRYNSCTLGKTKSNIHSIKQQLVKPLPSFTDSEEANIIETGTNGAGGRWDIHTGLIDGKGLAGTYADVDTRKKCGVSTKSSTKRAFFYMKLASPGKVMKLQLAFRTDSGYTSQGKNVRIQVGTSPKYNANNPVCTEIAQLSGTGLVDYD